MIPFVNRDTKSYGPEGELQPDETYELKILFCPGSIISCLFKELALLNDSIFVFRQTGRLLVQSAHCHQWTIRATKLSHRSIRWACCARNSFRARDAHYAACASQHRGHRARLHPPVRIREVWEDMMEILSRIEFDFNIVSVLLAKLVSPSKCRRSNGWTVKRFKFCPLASSTSPVSSHCLRVSL